MNITTRTTIVSNEQLDDRIQIWLLEEERFKSEPETWKCRRQNNVVPCTRTCYEGRNIAVARPAAWNDLTVQRTDSSLSLSAFWKLYYSIMATDFLAH